MRFNTRRIGRYSVAAALTVAVLGALGMQWSWGVQSSGRAVGIFVEQQDDKLAIVEVLTDLPAQKAGIEAGDLLVEISGHPIRDGFDYDVAASAFSRGREVTFRLEREGRALAVVVAPGIPHDWVPWSTGAVAAALHLALALLVLGSDIRGCRARLLIMLFMAIAVEMALPLDPIGFPTLAVVMSVLFWLLNGLQFGAELHLVSLIPGEHPWFAKRPWLATLYYALGLGLGLLLALSELPLLQDSSLVAWLFAPVGEMMIEAWFLLWPLSVLAILSYSALTWKEPLGRQQATMVQLGLAPWVVLSVAVAFMNLKEITYPDWVEAAEPLILVLYPIALFVAFYRYHLFDFELVVRKSLVYTTLTTALLLAFYGTLGAAGAFLSTFVDDPGSSVWVIGAATLILGLLFAPLRRLVEGLIERRFFPERATLRRKLGDLSRELPRLGKLPSICEEVESRLGDIFAVEWCCLLLRKGTSGLLARGSAREDGATGDSVHPYLLSVDDPYVNELQAVGRPLSPGAWSSESKLAAQFVEIRASLVLPVLAGSELKGILLMGDKTGGEDYPAEEIELLNLFSHHLATILDNVSLFESATIDGLTRLMRREALLPQLQRELDRALRYHRPLSVSLIDVDCFKAVNDRHGHLMGDFVLQSVASGIRRVLRQSDLVGRFGGDEFVLVLPETSLAGAGHIAELLRSEVASAQIESEAGGRVAVTVSIGVACLPELHGEGAATLELLLEQADRNLYLAKAAGKNRVCCEGVEPLQQDGSGSSSMALIQPRTELIR